MLDKLVIHLKNIIFFKTIIYIIIISLLFSLMPILQEDLTKSSNRKEESRGFLNQALIKLNSIIDFESKIIETNNAYYALIKDRGQSECQRKTDLLEKFEVISENYRLTSPIGMEITRLFEHTSARQSIDVVVLREDRLDLDFSVSDAESFLKISQDINAILPQGSIILTADIRESGALSSNITDKLSVSRKPDLFKAKMKVKLREVAYEK